MYITEPRLEKKADPRTGNVFARWHEGSDRGSTRRMSRKMGHKSEPNEINDAFERLRKELAARRLGTVDATVYDAKEIFEEYLEDLELNGRDPGQITLTRYNVGCFVNRPSVKTLADVNADQMFTWRTEMQRYGYASNTIRRRLGDLRGFCSWLANRSKVAANPFPKKILPAPVSIPRFYEPWEINGILANCASPTILAMVRMAYDLSAREGEVLRACGEDIRWIKAGQEADITLYLTKSRENQYNARTVPMTPELCEILWQFPRRGPLWPGWGKDKLYYWFKKAVDAAGVKAKLVLFRGKEFVVGPSFHALRHTFCKEYLENGGTTRDLMEFTGHKSESMMRVYAHFQKSYLRERLMATRAARIRRDSTACGQTPPTGILQAVEGKTVQSFETEGDATNPMFHMEHTEKTKRNGKLVESPSEGQIIN